MRGPLRLSKAEDETQGAVLLLQAGIRCSVSKQQVPLPVITAFPGITLQNLNSELGQAAISSISKLEFFPKSESRVSFPLLRDSP